MLATKSEIALDASDRLLILAPYPGVLNPDHRSHYLFTRVALWNLIGELQPALSPFLVHHPGWPEPEGLNWGLPSEPPERPERDAVWQVSRVAPAEKASGDVRRRNRSREAP